MSPLDAFAGDQIATFFLVLARVGGLFVLAPVFSSRTVPVRLRLGLAVAASLLALPTVEHSGVKLDPVAFGPISRPFPGRPDQPTRTHTEVTAPGPRLLHAGPGLAIHEYRPDLLSRRMRHPQPDDRNFSRTNIGAKSKAIRRGSAIPPRRNPFA